MRTETSPPPGSADEPKRRLEKLAGARTRHLKPRLAPKRATLRTKVHGFSSNATPNEPERPPSGQEKDAQATANEPRRQRTNPGGAKRTQATGTNPGRQGRGRAGAASGQGPEGPNEPKGTAIAAHVPGWRKAIAARGRGPLFWPGENV